MFSSFSGFKTHYGDLTLLVISEFNEWKVLAYKAGVIIQGGRQFTADKAKELAVTIAENYLREQGGGVAVAEAIKWEPTGKQDWMVWRG
jgi:hypothetical protein